MNLPTPVWIMLRLLLVVALTVPFADLYLLVKLSEMYGFLQVLAVVVGTGLAGAFLVKREGVDVLRRLGSSVTALEASRNVIEGLLLALAALGLLLPGVLSDMAGIVLLLRPVRQRLAVRLSERLQRSEASFQVQSFGV